MTIDPRGSAACSRCGCIGGDECEHIDCTCWTQKNAATTKRLYWAGWWRFGSYNIGATKVLMLGPVRWFRRD